jgi:hypothetical protein
MSRDDFNKGVRDILAHRAGFRCSKPDCRAPTSGPNTQGEGHINLGVAAHITAASAGGPRYDPRLSPEDRGSASNGIWLCHSHAHEIDVDVVRFSVEVLKSWKRHAEDAARAMLGRPISAMGVDVVLDVSLQRDLNDGLVVIGETSLPDGTKMMGNLRRGGPALLAQAECIVKDRRLLLGPFTQSRHAALPQHWYEIDIYSYFNAAWAQPTHVLDLVGSEGANLAGRLAQAVDPELDDTEYSVQARFECPAPPLALESELSQAETKSAIQLLRGSFLTVGGEDEPSTKTVEDILRSFLENGLTEHEGWKASVTTQGVVDVTYSFLDGNKPKVARWQVMPRAGEIRCRNQAAKMVSWCPPKP